MNTRIVSQKQLQEGYYEAFQQSPMHPPVIYNRRYRVIREIPDTTPDIKPGGPWYVVEDPRPVKESP